ncbi:MAG: hypothetical protein ACR2P0_13990 [Acidimicrobiales bacterium]
MAIAEDLNREFGSDLDPFAALDRAFGHVMAELMALPVDAAVRQSGQFQNRLAALEAELLASQLRDGGTKREAENTVGRGTKTSKKEAAKRAKRADAVKENPDLADDLADGELGPEQLDALADASSKSDGCAAKDQGLINRVKDAPPDDAARLTREWLDDHRTEDEHEQRRTRQRRQRLVKRFQNRRGNQVVWAEGDDETLDEIWKTLSAKADDLYRADGGRDTPVAHHRRTRNQRLFDALHQLTTTQQGGGRGKTAAPIVHIGLTVDHTDAALIHATGATGKLPRSVIDRYLCTATFISTVFDTRGQVLWHGRKIRYATPTQMTALVARDRGCVLCGADPSHCVAHHLLPWHAPNKGHTNIDNLALVCDDCHHHIHDNKLTLRHHTTQQRWRLKPATPNETPPSHPRNRSQPAQE